MKLSPSHSPAAVQTGDGFADLEGEAGLGNDSSSACPVCGHLGGQEWLLGKDRFHGRSETYALVHCPACSFVWQSHPPAPEKMHLHYTEAYHRLISESGQNSPVRWRDRKAALAPHKQSGALLDLGCSSGAFLESMRGESWKLYGIEMSSETARTAEARTGAQVFVGDILDASFAPESMDVITCFDVLEHVYEPRQLIQKVVEWLKPGGIFYVLVPNIDSAEARLFGTYWYGLELPRHISHFSPASLSYMAKTVGLEEVSLKTGRNQAVGISLRYVWDDVLSVVGIHKTPVAYRKAPGLLWRVARKFVQMSILRGLLALAPLAGEGESIHGVFRKPTCST